MAMEYFERGSLSDLIRTGGPMPTDVVVRVGLEVADALSAAHASGIVHRDIKPANILVGRRDEAVLTDFGIASLVDSTRSATGSFTGTLAFSAPEVLLGHRADERSDIYALGVTLDSLLRGASTFAAEGTAPGAVIQRVLNDTVPELPGEVPESLRDLVRRAMAKDPGERFSSVEEFSRALGEKGIQVDSPAITAPLVAGEPAASELGGIEDPATVRRELSAPELPVTSLPAEPEQAVAGALSGSSEPTTIGRRRLLVGGCAAVAGSAIVGGLGALRLAAKPVNPISTSIALGTDYDVSDLVAGETGVWLVSGGVGSVEDTPVELVYIDKAKAAITSSVVLMPSSDAAFVSAMAVGEGAVWILVTSFDGVPDRVLRLESTSLATIAEIEMPDSASGLATGAGGIWTRASESGGSSLLRIDPATNRARPVAELGEMDAVRIAADGSSVWLVGIPRLAGTDEEWEAGTAAQLIRVSTRSNQVEGILDLGEQISEGSWDSVRLVAKDDSLFIGAMASWEGVANELIRVDSEGPTEVFRLKEGTTDGALAWPDLGVMTLTAQLDSEGFAEQTWVARRSVDSGEIIAKVEMPGAVNLVGDGSSMWVFSVEFDGEDIPVEQRLELLDPAAFDTTA